MNSRKALAAAWLALFLAGSAAAGPAALDDSGEEIRLAGPATRIVSLAPHLTELLFAAGAGDRIVGTVSYSDFPPPATGIPRVGNAQRLDLERILMLQPDLVVAWKSGNPGTQVRRLREAGLAVYVSESRRLEDIAATIETLGRLAGTRVEAGRAAATFHARLASLRRRYGEGKPLRVFYQIWNDPIITIGGPHVISDVIALCGGRNVFAGIDQLAPAVSVESVLAEAPEVIIAGGSGGRPPAWLSDWRRWPGLPAVRDGALHTIPPALLQRATPRILDGAERLCEILEEARREPQSARSRPPVRRCHAAAQSGT